MFKIWTLLLLIFLSWVAVITFIVFVYTIISYFGILIGSALILCNIYLIAWFFKMFYKAMKIKGEIYREKDIES